MRSRIKNTFIIMLAALALSLAACQAEGNPTPPPASATSAQGETAQPTPSAAPQNTEPPYWKDPSNYTVVDMLGISATTLRESTQDVLTPIWRDTTGVYARVVDVLTQPDITQYLKDAEANGSLPEMLAAEQGIFDVPERMAIVKPRLLPIPKETARAHMPLTIERLAKMGLSFDEWYDANADPETGVWLAVPALPSPLFDDNLPTDTRYYADQVDLPIEYVWVRDDVMQSVNPSALVKADIEDWVMGRQSNITLTDLNTDEWMFTRDSLGEFLSAVKAGFPSLIPAHITIGADPGAIVYSFFGASGLWWTGDYPELINNYASGGGYFSHYAVTPEWNGYLSWLNAAFNEGWFGQDFFTINQSQRAERIKNGEYCVVNWWLGEPSAGTWRLWPVIEGGLVSDKQDLSVYRISLKTSYSVGFIADKVDDALLAKLLGWVDWNYSLEAQDLRAWGVGMSDGQGADRRFDKAYSSVYESLMGLELTTSADAGYYGLVDARVTAYEYWNHEVYGIGGSDIGPDAPFYTYPLVRYAAQTGQATVPSQAYLIPSLVKQYFIETGQLKIEKAEPSAGRDPAMDELYASFKASFAQELSQEMRQALLNCVSGTQAAFDSNYAAYKAAFERSDTAKLLPLIRAYLEQEFSR